MKRDLRKVEIRSQLITAASLPGQLSPETSFKNWLAPTVNKAEDVAAMLDYARDDFEFYPVSTRLKAVRDDDPELMKPLQ